LAEISEAAAQISLDLLFYADFYSLYEVKQIAFVAPYAEENCSHSLGSEIF
jgi:hypothetical protein